METRNEARTMYYGKGDVLVYRTFAKPLANVRPIPESSFTGHDNVVFALNIKIAVRGDAFLPSFTEGDNSMVVATDSMKNFILRHTADFTGDTVESLLLFLSGRFLETYAHMSSIEMTAHRIPFETVKVPGAVGLEPSKLVYRRSHNEHPSAALLVEREPGGGVRIAEHSCSISDLQLMKVKGSSFAGFIRDRYTTLPEAKDRPLFIFLDIGWRYADANDAVDSSRSRYVPAEQVRDIAHTVFHEMNSPSIQNLIYHIGLRVLRRFPQLAEVWFESNNRTWETVIETIPGSEGSVYTEPRPPYGFQGFSLTRKDLPEEAES